MAATITKLVASKLYSELSSKSGTLVLSRLNELDNASPSQALLAVLKQAYDNETDRVLQFQMKKSLRLMSGKLKSGKMPQVTPEQIESLLVDQTHLDDLALAVACLDAASGFIAADQLRGSDWQYFPATIFPSFCNFFKKYGGFEDVPVLLELTRSSNSIVVISAIDALETIDPTNLLGIVEPLLTSTSSTMRAQAIQVYYKWNRKDAIEHFSKLLFSSNPQDRSIAIFHAEFFAYEDIETLLIKLIPQINNQYDLMNIMKILVKNAYADLPLKIFTLNKNVTGEQQGLIKGVLLNIIRELGKRGIIQGSIQDYLAKLKQISSTNNPAEPQTSKAQETALPNNETAKPAAVTQKTNHQAEQTEQKIEQPPKQTQADDKGEPVLDKSSIEEVQDGFANFDTLPEKKQIQILARTNYDLFKENESTLKKLSENSKGKLLASFVTLFSKYSKEQSFINKVKQLCNSENTDVVCACIKSLAKLDNEHLCLYLPKYLQHQNGKIRMTATRVCAEIDPKQVERLITGMVNSANTKQRTIGISTTMLVNFNIVKEPLLAALKKESNVDLIKNIGMVLAANPDKDILYRAYEISQTTRVSEAAAMDSVITLIAEKLSVLLNHEQTPAQLRGEAVQKYRTVLDEQKKAGMNSLQSGLDNAEKQAAQKIEQKKARDKQLREQADKEIANKEFRKTLSVIIFIVLSILIGIFAALALLQITGLN